mmetsp:Transcript_34367/g.83574  ORF Transcript_34367/g.83574 Transcript_34367/m.83574 type:complete len:208 (-) Transcript_34367:1753-2376(-)
MYATLSGESADAIPSDHRRTGGSPLATASRCLVSWTVSVLCRLHLPPSLSSLPSLAPATSSRRTHTASSGGASGSSIGRTRGGGGGGGVAAGDGLISVASTINALAEPMCGVVQARFSGGGRLASRLDASRSSSRFHVVLIPSHAFRHAFVNCRTRAAANSLISAGIFTSSSSPSISSRCAVFDVRKRPMSPERILKCLPGLRTTWT